LTPNFYEQLGANEVGLLVLGSPADQDACPEAIGRVVQGVEVRVSDPSGQELPAGQAGLVGFRSENFPALYVGDPEATERSFRDGWFYPGDLAAIDAAGYFHFKGRADDVINSKGVKFYPIEVEKALLAHACVAEAAVFGWPHPDSGEVAVAFVTRSGPVSASELVQFCRQRLAAHKIPHSVAVVEQMPKTPTGKIMKRALKEKFRDLVTGGSE
jgi:acyl-coenzyme A synthetase/AMP-(fatty) acid ligase